MLVSIIINNYNYARFLRAAIDSALGQSYASIEVLVVDDGSTDQSRAIIDSYGDRVKSILKKNGGQASALNAGFAQCQGDIVIFLDADDVLCRMWRNPWPKYSAHNRKRPRSNIGWKSSIKAAIKPA